MRMGHLYIITACVFTAFIGGCIFGAVGGYADGYRAGQVDAARGQQHYHAVTREAWEVNK